MSGAVTAPNPYANLAPATPQASAPAAPAPAQAQTAANPYAQLAPPAPAPGLLATLNAPLRGAGAAALRGTGEIAAAAPRLVQGALAGLRGSPERYLQLFNKIDKGYQPTLAEDPLGYSGATPARRKELRAGVLEMAKSPAATQPGTVEKLAGMAAGDVEYWSNRGAAAIDADPRLRDNIAYKAASMVGGMAPYVVASVVGGLPAAAGAMFGQAYDQGFDEALAKGASPDVANQAALLNGAVAANLIALPVVGWTGTLAPAVRGKIVSALLRSAVSSGTMVTYSEAQQIGSNVIAGQTYAPGTPVLSGTGNIGPAAIAGAVLGLPFSGVHEATPGLPPEPQPAAPTGASTTPLIAPADRASQAAPPSPLVPVAPKRPTNPKYAFIWDHLSDAERELWSKPFNPAASPEQQRVRQALSDRLAELDKLYGTLSPAAKTTAARKGGAQGELPIPPTPPAGAPPPAPEPTTPAPTPPAEPPSPAAPEPSPPPSKEPIAPVVESGASWAGGEITSTLQSFAAPPAVTSGVVMLRPDQIALDPQRFQYKASDERGVTGALVGGARWEPLLANPVTVWQDNEGRLWMVNGHQRLDLANRATAAGQQGVEIPAKIIREADGITPTIARAIGAFQNIAEGSGTPIDAARVLRDLKDVPDNNFRLPDLPPASALVRMARALVKLSPQAFEAMEALHVPPEFAAPVGDRLTTPEEQMAAIDMLARHPPQNANQARIMVADIANAGFLRGNQTTLFGEEEFTQSLVPERAQVLDAALRSLHGAKRTFTAAVRGEETLTGAGNVMAGATNEARARENAELIDALKREALVRGPVSDALSNAARELAAGKPIGKVAAEFVRVARGLVGRGATGGDENRPSAGGEGDEGAPGAAVDEGAIQAEGQSGLGFASISAYHASPYQFEKFSLEHLGKGEGAQAYGRGMYYAQNPDVMEYYWDQFRRRMDPEEGVIPDAEATAKYKAAWDTTVDLRRGMTKISSDRLRGAFSQWIAENSPVRAEIRAEANRSADVVPAWAIHDAHAFLDATTREPHLQGHELLTAISQYIDGLDRYLDSIHKKMIEETAERYAKIGGPHRYEVSLPGEEANYLDWDRPLKEQPAAAEFFQGVPGIGPDSTGGEAYMLTGRGNEAALAAALHNSGILGVRYADQFSRQAVSTAERVRVAKEIQAKQAAIGNFERLIAALQQEMERNRNHPGLLPSFFEHREADIANARGHIDRLEKEIEELSREPQPTYNYVVFDPDPVQINRMFQRRGKAEKYPQVEMFSGQMPGAAIQAQAARDQTGRGLLMANVPQKPMNEGLFAPPEPEQLAFNVAPEPEIEGNESAGFTAYAKGKQPQVAAREYVVMRGKAEKNEFLVALDAKTGKPTHSVTSGQPDWVDLPEIAEGNAIVVHHNHPSSRSLSFDDLRTMFIAPEVAGVVAHGQDGQFYAAAPTPRAVLNPGIAEGALKHIEKWVMVMAEAHSKELRHTAYQWLMVVPEYDGHIVNALAHAVGLIHYWHNIELPADAATFWRPIITAFLEKNGVALDRLPPSISLERGMVAVHSTAGELARQGRGARARSPEQSQRNLFGEDRRLAEETAPAPTGGVKDADDLVSRLGWLGATHAALQRAADRFSGLGETIAMMTNPMSVGSDVAKRQVKDWANVVAHIQAETSRLDDWVAKHFTPEQRRAMWQAGETQNLQELHGQPSAAIASLPEDQRNLVRSLQHHLKTQLVIAAKLGMFRGKPLPSYVPHIIAHVGEPNAVVVRDVRTMILAMRQLGTAIAGRQLIENIRHQGLAVGRTLVSEGEPQFTDTRPTTGGGPGNPLNPPGRDIATATARTRKRKYETAEEAEQAARRAPKKQRYEGYFTVPESAAFWNFRVVGQRADGSPEVVKNLVWVSNEYRGPLKSVLGSPAERNKIYTGLMDLKGRMMTGIMYGVSHLFVIGARILPMSYHFVRMVNEGYSGRQDPATLRRFTLAGLRPISRHFGQFDIEGMVQPPSIEPGRSWTSQIVGAIARPAGPGSALAAKRAVDKAGDIAHRTLLWDRVADLQMGLAIQISRDLVAKGNPQQASDRAAAYLANAFSGALPREAMSAAARITANLLLFSRSYRFGSLQVIKAALKQLGRWPIRKITGHEVKVLPGDIRAQIKHESGVEALLKVDKDAGRMALGAALVDLGLYYVAGSLAQSAINVMLGWSNLGSEVLGYLRRFGDEIYRIGQSPWANLNPFDALTALSPESEHEPGKQNRILIGFDRSGRGVYLRPLAGKSAEDIVDYATQLRSTVMSAMSPYMKPIMALLLNESTPGHPLYDPTAPSSKQAAEAISNLAKIAAGAATPNTALVGLWKLLTGKGGWYEVAQIAGAGLGASFSRGFPGGPAEAEVWFAKQGHNYQVQQEMPQIRAMIRNGNIEGAVAKMDRLGMPKSLQKWEVRAILSPGPSRGGIKEFNLYATPQERARYERAIGGAQ